MKKFWFTRKQYGWGWQPATWQGWVSLLVFVILLTINVMSIDWNSKPSPAVGVRFAVQTMVLSALLIVLAYKKGEKPKWQWGEKKDTDSIK